MHTFTDLPIEIHREIALHLEVDADIVNYASVMTDTYQAVEGYGGIYRSRLLNVFDAPLEMSLTHEECKAEYKFRIENIVKTPGWSGYNAMNMVLILINLIRESYNPAPGQPTPIKSKNIKFIAELVRKLDILNNFGNFAPGNVRNTDLARNAVQLLLFPWTLERGNLVWGYGRSRRVAFSALAEQSLCRPQTLEINHLYLLDICNFFAKNCGPACNNFTDLSVMYNSLEDFEKPKIWSQKLEQGPHSLGMKWYGMFGQMSMDDLAELWQDFDFGDQEPLPEMMTSDDWDEFQIQMSDPADSSDPVLEGFFESCLHSHPPKEQIHGLEDDIPSAEYTRQLHGTGKDGVREKRFELIGDVEALPEQAGIPGWQRISFLKFFSNDEGRGERFRWLKYRSIDEVRQSDCELWAYEGVMIPGNNFIIGRWFIPQGPRIHLDENCGWATGPSIMWCVDEGKTEFEDRRCKMEEKSRQIDFVVSDPWKKDPKMQKPEGTTSASTDHHSFVEDSEMAKVAESERKEGKWNWRLGKEDDRLFFRDQTIPPPIQLAQHAVETPPASAVTPKNQFYHEMARTYCSPLGPELLPKNAKASKGGKPAGEDMAEIVTNRDVRSRFTKDLEAVKLAMARTEDICEKATMAVGLMQGAMGNELVDDLLSGQDMEFFVDVRRKYGRPSIFSRIRDDILRDFEKEFVRAMNDVGVEAVDTLFDGDEEKWMRAQGKTVAEL